MFSVPAQILLSVRRPPPPDFGPRPPPPRGRVLLRGQGEGRGLTDRRRRRRRLDPRGPPVGGAVPAVLLHPTAQGLRVKVCREQQSFIKTKP